MELTKVETPVKVMSGFGKRNASEARIKQEEEELKKLTEANNDPAAATNTDEDGSDAGLSAEDKSFKKRYGDLRRHTQKQQVDMQKEKNPHNNKQNQKFLILD